MEKGSIYLVIHFPKNFPNGINYKTEIISSVMENSTFKIYAFPDGHFQIIVQDQDKIYSEFESQQIRFQSDRDRIITYIWSSSQTNFKINNKTVDSMLSKEVLVIQDENSTQKNDQIGDMSSSDFTTEKWIKWRKERFIDMPRSIKSDRREKSEVEQVKELSDIAKALEDTFNDWLTGKDYLFMNLLSLLRSLLCHYVNDKKTKRITYNPLLFRVASFKSLPLPIYSMPVNTQIPQNILDISDNTLYHIIANEATLSRKNNNQIIMDFQEWINGEVIIIFKDRKPDCYSVNNLLLESSNTIGGSHFDPDIPIRIDFLKNLTSFDIDLIKRIVANTVQISIFISKNLISHFKLYK
jgi:hypothetical protein